MKPRVLLPNGKFQNYTGALPSGRKDPKKSVAAKVAERKAYEKDAEEAGFDANTEVDGELSKEDLKQVEAGMALVDLMLLAKSRGIKVPKDLESRGDVEAFLLGSKPLPDEKAEAELSAADVKKVRKGLSIPEMKKLAKAAGVKIPSKLKKSADIRTYLLDLSGATEGSEPEDDDL